MAIGPRLWNGAHLLLFGNDNDYSVTQTGAGEQLDVYVDFNGHFAKCPLDQKTLCQLNDLGAFSESVPRRSYVASWRAPRLQGLGGRPRRLRQADTLVLRPSSLVRASWPVPRPGRRLRRLGVLVGTGAPLAKDVVADQQRLTRRLPIRMTAPKVHGGFAYCSTKDQRVFPPSASLPSCSPQSRGFRFIAVAGMSHVDFVPRPSISLGRSGVFFVVG